MTPPDTLPERFVIAREQKMPHQTLKHARLDNSYEAELRKLLISFDPEFATTI